MSQLKPDIFDRDRPFRWNLFGFMAPRSKYGVGNEWRHFEEDDGSLRCEECGYENPEDSKTAGDQRSTESAHGRAVMIVNDPFDPETPVDLAEQSDGHSTDFRRSSDFDSPTQVLCRTCVREELPVDSEYRDANVKQGSSSDLDPENLEGIPT